MQLDSGRYQGKVIISWEALQKTRIANTWINSSESARYPTHFEGYGLGLFMQDYAGKQLYWHTGGAGGMVSNVCFIPEIKLGVAILTNNDNQNFFEALRYQILDAYTGVPYG
jgi:CubicO group peptidase (beta-lactamase class C family)